MRQRHSRPQMLLKDDETRDLRPIPKLNHLQDDINHPSDAHIRVLRGHTILFSPTVHALRGTGRAGAGSEPQTTLGQAAVLPCVTLPPTTGAGKWYHSCSRSAGQALLVQIHS